MAHSADYQTVQYIKRLEKICVNLGHQSGTLRANGFNELADAVFDQVEQLNQAIADLKKALEMLAILLPIPLKNYVAILRWLQQGIDNAEPPSMAAHLMRRRRTGKPSQGVHVSFLIATRLTTDLHSLCQGLAPSR